MQQTRSDCDRLRATLREHPLAFRAGPAQAEQLRRDLARLALAASQGQLALAVARPEGALVRGAPGHFHHSAELFLQCAGHTDFHFPNGHHRLEAEHALLVPAMVLHEERAASAGPLPAHTFRNLVLHAEADTVSCHLAHEHPIGHPAVLHLESLRHPLAQRIHDWLADAARLGRAAQTEQDPWATAQARALVAAALVATLRLLGPAQAAPASPGPRPLAAPPDGTPAPAPPERLPATQATALPELLARAGLLLANQLGEHQLSVQGLATQCGCSADHLSRLFARHHGGQPLKARILQLRLERAAHLLADTPLSVKEVSWACGFAGASHFIRAFKGRFQATPLAWRERHLSTARLPPGRSSTGRAMPALGDAAPPPCR